ncbi:MAG: toll/interleukin-1 receptor domain-containing protein, partial [Acidobacteria bacterium]|nr:toll/interleukin-1 receptor domain-containing protein [Acidobacteriota bacterium]
METVRVSLEDGRDIECWFDEDKIAPGDDIVVQINGGLANCDLVVVFLSETSVRSRWVEQELGAAFWDQVNSGKTRLIPVLIDDCVLPPLLKTKKYVDLRTNQLDGMGKLKSAILRAGPQTPAPAMSYASLPNFVGRERELAELKERLSQPGAVVPVTGMAGIGKTWLAREMIRRHGGLFEAVYELDCQSRNLPAFVADLAAQVGLRMEGSAEQAAAELRLYLKRKRCLLLLDNVEDDQPGQLVPEGRASVLATSRRGDIPFLAEHIEVKPELFRESEAFDLFRRVLGEVDETAARDLFPKLGYLPVALAVAAGLIKKDVRYTVASLAAKLPPLENLAHGRNNVGRLLKSAIASVGETERALLAAMAACAPAGVRLDFAAKVAGFEEMAALEALQELFARSLVVELDRETRRYRLHPLVREAAAPTEAVRKRQAEETLQALEGWERSPLSAAEYLEEADQAVGSGAGGPLTCVSVATRAGNLASALGRLSLGYDFHQRGEQISAKAGRQDWLQANYGNQALIL